MVKQRKSLPSSKTDNVVVRLLRCLPPDDRFELLSNIATQILETSAGDADESNKAIAVSDSDTSFEDFILNCFWSTNAARDEIDAMRDYDDPFWEAFGEPVDFVLFGGEADDRTNAAFLAEHYLEFCEKYALPIRGDFVEENDWDDGAFYTDEFKKFIAEWRECVVTALEKAAQP